MTKAEFLSGLDARLGALSLSDKEKSLEYYAEMIDDRIEEGLDEATAIREIGTIEDAAAQILMEMPLAAPVKPKRSRNLWLWICSLPLLIVFGGAALAILISYWAVIFTLLVSFFAVVATLFAGAIFGIIGGFLQIIAGNPSHGIALISAGNPLQGIAFIGAGCVCAGLGILAFIGIKPVWKCALRLFAAPVRLLKKLIVGRRI